MNTQTHLTIGELSKQTQTPYYKVQYLDRLGKLPKVKESTGRGDPSIFAPEAVQIVLDHVMRSSKNKG
ncbi:MAG: MerR family transcriptional regulator [Candidatus Brocadiales bacterium]|nr:MerR family transcriptional regulator [Candidatus Brocadiales bacterium]